MIQSYIPRLGASSLGSEPSRSFTEALQKLHRSFTEALPKLHRSFTEALQKLYRSFTEASQKLHRSCVEHINITGGLLRIRKIRR
jgi:carbamoylphosphate synthase large subunit